MRKRRLLVGLLATFGLLLNSCGDSGGGSGATVTIVGVLSVGVEYGGISADGIILSPSKTVHLATAGAAYEIDIDEDLDLTDIQSSSLYRVTCKLGDSLEPTEYDSHPGRWIQVEKYELIKEYTDADRDIVFAARDANFPEVIELIEQGADVNARTPRYESPLGEILYATRNIDSQETLDSLTEIVGLLLARGSDPDARDEGGFTALHSSARYHSTEINRMLISAGADVNPQNVFGSTPLHYAVKEGKLENARMLIDGGARLDITDEDGLTPLEVTQDATFQSLLAPGQDATE